MARERLVIRDHRRAFVANAHVESLKEEPPKEQRSYGAHCHKLAVLVHQAGLAAALHHSAALRHPKPLLVEHLAIQLHEANLIGQPSKDSLLAATRGADLSTTWLLTREAQRCLEWYRRLAHGVLGVRSASDEEGQ
jgi:CRISPR/Cas system CMR-associated protein Cmr5 small subunit